MIFYIENYYFEFEFKLFLQDIFNKKNNNIFF